jgi:hypothetical protein
MDEVVVDGVTYVRVHYPCPVWVAGDPSRIWDQFNKKEREEIRRRIMAVLVEVGVFVRKDGCKKGNIVYKKDELFYGM